MKRQEEKKQRSSARTKRGRWASEISRDSIPRFEQLENRLMLSLLGIGVEIGLPDVDYDSNGSLAYDHSSYAFDAVASPTGITLAAGARPVRITAPRDFQLHIRVDNNGDLLGGVDGHDLLIEGVIDVNRDRIPEYDGVLLTGEIVAFGYLNTLGSDTDQYDFRFTVTGGLLESFFVGKDIGLDMTSLVSTVTDGFFNASFAGGSQGVLGPIDPIIQVPDSSLAGRVFVDANNNGVDDGEAGIESAVVTLTGTDIDGNVVNMATVTLADGSYLFEGLAPGTYTVTEAPQPEGLLDGSDAAGTLGGVVGNDVISGIVITGGEAATGYNFAEIAPASISGLVFEDFNNDGAIDFNEKAIEGVTMTLSGVDDLGNAVTATTLSDSDGIYFFLDLRPGNYTVTETQPLGYADGADSLGTIDGVAVGTLGNDVISGIELPVGSDGINYNFAERPEAGSTVTSGQTATIGFWQNKNGQTLIKSLNGGGASTQLADWLAATLPNIYGINAAGHNLTGLNNTDVASFYRNQLFKVKKQKGLAGPAKLDAQVMATIFAVYATNINLAGTTAEAYGFTVTDGGVGTSTINVGDSGEAFGVADYIEMMIIDILLATDALSADGDGILYDLEDALIRAMANLIYTAINEGGDI